MSITFEQRAICHESSRELLMSLAHSVLLSYGNTKKTATKYDVNRVNVNIKALQEEYLKCKWN